MKVALFGAGRIGKVHAASIRMDRRSELVAVTDVMSDAADALATEYGIAARQADDILADASIDAILVASSTNTHADLIERGIAAGKAVFCEKPIDLDLQRALRVKKAVAAAGRRCCCSSWHRTPASTSPSSMHRASPRCLTTLMMMLIPTRRRSAPSSASA